ncbi:hypothetical protein ETD83_24245 [Actinomadura soli]|uniref:Lipoprotein n=1 Tax=Actinomadura soli TaxID=2508997 RepID=A0A5C4J9T2_9ACTN|nr:hypothetical protein [Actinomadura soli]TMQ94210.1 hypothetical protein ETD83_24245 [Actinomadura soli]
MFDGRRLMLAAAVMALCVGCSSSSSGGDVICAPCRPPVMVTVSGLDRLTVEGVRMRVCVGEQPCADFRVTRRPETESFSCGSVACSLLETGALQVTLPQREARTVADLPVRVTASSRQGQREGAATMKYVPDKGPCKCDYSYANVALG